MFVDEIELVTIDHSAMTERGATRQRQRCDRPRRLTASQTSPTQPTRASGRNGKRAAGPRTLFCAVVDARRERRTGPLPFIAALPTVNGWSCVVDVSPRG